MQALGIGLARIGGGTLLRTAFGWFGRRLVGLGAKYIAPFVESGLGKWGLASLGTTVATKIPGLLEKGVGYLEGKVFGSHKDRSVEKPHAGNGFEFAPRNRPREPSEFESMRKMRISDRGPKPVTLDIMKQIDELKNQNSGTYKKLGLANQTWDRSRIKDTGKNGLISNIPMTSSIYVPKENYGSIGKYLN